MIAVNPFSFTIYTNCDQASTQLAIGHRLKAIPTVSKTISYDNLTHLLHGDEILHLLLINALHQLKVLRVELMDEHAHMRRVLNFHRLHRRRLGELKIIHRT